MGFLKEHWFGIIIGCWFFVLSLFVAVILIAPHQDAKNRGFVYCNQNFVEQISECNNANLCVVKAILYNTGCDITIIKQSFIDWLHHKHPYPWSGYIFDPEPLTDRSTYFDKDEIEEYLQEYPDTVQEMEKLKQLRKDLENAQNEESTN